jgi:hypothetical protein
MKQDLFSNDPCGNPEVAVIYEQTTADGVCRYLLQPVQSRDTPAEAVGARFARMFTVPMQILPSDLQPRPGDVIEDVLGLRWAILSAEHHPGEQLWQFGTVALVPGQDLTDVITIERVTDPRDSKGPAVKPLPPADGLALWTLAARLQPLPRESAGESAMSGTGGRWQALVAGPVPPVTLSTDRVRWINEQGQTVVFTVVEIHNPPRLDEPAILDLEECR